MIYLIKKTKGNDTGNTYYAIDLVSTLLKGKRRINLVELDDIVSNDVEHRMTPYSAPSLMKAAEKFADYVIDESVLNKIYNGYPNVHNLSKFITHLKFELLSTRRSTNDYAAVADLLLRISRNFDYSIISITCDYYDNTIVKYRSASGTLPSVYIKLDKLTKLTLSDVRLVLKDVVDIESTLTGNPNSVDDLYVVNIRLNNIHYNIKNKLYYCKHTPSQRAFYPDWC